MNKQIEDTPVHPTTVADGSHLPVELIVEGAINRLCDVGGGAYLNDDGDDDDNDDNGDQLNWDERQRLLPRSNSVHHDHARPVNINPPDMAVNNNHHHHEHTNDDQFKANESISGINYYIYLVTILSAIGGFLFGYDTGIVSGAMVFIRDHFELTSLWQEFIVSATILFAWIFSLIAGYLTNSFGRKLVIILASFVFTLGSCLMAWAQSKYVLLGGRAVVGLAIGLASMSIPVYISEVAPVQIRGKLVAINTCFVTFGQFVASVVAGLFSYDSVDGWRWMLGLAAAPAIIQLVFFSFMPESPRWLVQKARYEQAYDSLRKFRSNTSTEAIKQEFESIKDNYLESRRIQDSKSTMEIVKNPVILRALLVGGLLMMFQQLAGINTVMYYSATIIQMSGIHDKSTAVWLSSLTASINFIFSIVGLLLVERIGRRLLTLSSLFGVIVSLIILAVGFQLAIFNSPPVTFHPVTNQSSICAQYSNCNQCVTSEVCGFCFGDLSFSNVSKSSSAMSNWVQDTFSPKNMNGTCLMIDKKDPFRSAENSMFCANGSTSEVTWSTNWCPSQYSIMTLAGLMLYLCFFAPGMGPMPWTINSEIYPLWARSFCYSLSTSFNWFFNLLVSLTFLTLTQILTTYGAFYLYSGLALVGWLLFYFLLPETKGKSLEQIESIFETSLFDRKQTNAPTSGRHQYSFNTEVSESRENIINFHTQEQ